MGERLRRQKRMNHTLSVRTKRKTMEPRKNKWRGRESLVSGSFPVPSLVPHEPCSRLSVLWTILFLAYASLSKFLELWIKYSLKWQGESQGLFKVRRTTGNSTKFPFPQPVPLRSQVCSLCFDVLNTYTDWMMLSECFWPQLSERNNQNGKTRVFCHLDPKEHWIWHSFTNRSAFVEV